MAEENKQLQKQQLVWAEKWLWVEKRISPLRAVRFDRNDGFWGADGSLRGASDEVDGAEDAGGDGLDFVEVLHLEAVAVFFD